MTTGVAPRGQDGGLGDALRQLDWGFVDADTGHDGHDAIPYPCKFPPQLPAQLIAELTDAGSLVVDCFSGSGTAVVEAIRLGRDAVALDANPFAVLATRVKAMPPTRPARRELLDLADEVLAMRVCSHTACEALTVAPRIPNREKWFADSVYHELAHIRLRLDESSGPVRDVADVALCQAASRVSFQDSETRYVSVPRVVTPEEGRAAFANELRRLVKRLPASFPGRLISATAGDARSRESWQVEDSSVDLLVTSPPYPNAYDYHLYQRFRIFWLREDPVELKRIEVGSHLRHQSVSDPVADYESDMLQVLTRAASVLKPGGHAALVVGDGVYGGKPYRTAEGIVSLAAHAGLRVEAVLDRQLPATKRSVTLAGRRLRTEQIVLLSRANTVLRRPPNYATFGYEEELAARELDAAGLGTLDVKGAFSRLAFSSSVVTDEGEVPTWQSALEGAGDSRRKNSTYVTHGLHRYKGKFYPQLGKCLINLSGRRDGLVLDPFCGSGTIPLESALLGRQGFGIELNPVGANVARAKVAALGLSVEALDELDERVPVSVPRARATIRWDQFDAEAQAELESWFAPRVLVRLSHLLGHVRTASQAVSEPLRGPTQLLAEACVSDLIREVSHQEPSDLRIRRRRRPLTDAPVESLFNARWLLATRKLRHYQALLARGLPATGGTDIRQGDSRDAANWPDAGQEITAVISSPPYASALPYIDTDRLSMAAVFGWHKAARGSLENALVGSREIGTRGTRQWENQLHSVDVEKKLPSSTTDFLRQLHSHVLADDTAGFRRRQAPAVLTRYFCGMSDVLGIVSDRLAADGHAWLAMGDSRITISGVERRIPTTDEVAAIAIHRGLRLRESIAITVTRENMLHAKNAITANTLLHLTR